ncbi:hypothetical protein HDV57DRAFT_448570 [Trichoderma longibrachiatum]
MRSRQPQSLFAHQSCPPTGHPLLFLVSHATLGARSSLRNVSHQNVTGRDENMEKTKRATSRSKVLMSGPSCVREQLHVSMPKSLKKTFAESLVPLRVTHPTNRHGVAPELCALDAIGSTLGRVQVCPENAPARSTPHRLQVPKKGCNRSTCKLQVHNW